MDHRSDADDFMRYVGASPTPRHCVAESVRRLEAQGFVAGLPGDADVRAGYSVRAGSLLAWRRGASDGPIRVITAHTDSPNLRIKPRPETTGAGLAQFGVEVYGSPLVNSWLDRDLGLAGHVALRTGDAITTELVTIDRPVLRIPQLAIHLDREINSKGLQLNRQQHLKPMWGMAAAPGDASAADGDSNAAQAEPTVPTLRDLIAREIDVAADAILAFELMVFDVTPPAYNGWNDDFVASPRIDNQLSCWAGVEALVAADAPGVQIIALFDHEEVGSTSSTGADSNLLADALDAFGPAPAGSPSLCVSADCSHATHPNYPDRHDPDHNVALNGGPVIKVNANERYATTAYGHALFADACARAEVPSQVFVSRSDMACGSTVGPVTAARTGLDTVDIGAPQLSMHSAREVTGSRDPHFLRRALTAVFSS